MSANKTALAYFADNGEYYDSIDDIPADILIGRIRAMERVMSAPDKFPDADTQAIENAWPSLCAVAAGRLLFLD